MRRASVCLFFQVKQEIEDIEAKVAGFVEIAQQCFQAPKSESNDKEVEKHKKTILGTNEEYMKLLFRLDALQTQVCVITALLTLNTVY